VSELLKKCKNHYRHELTDCLCGLVVSYSPTTPDVINVGSNPTRDLSKIFLTFMLFGDIHSLFIAIMRISLSIYFTLIQKNNTQHIARRLIMQITRARLASGTQYAVAYMYKTDSIQCGNGTETEIAYLVLQNVFLVV